jgi:hypothetical protein
MADRDQLEFLSVILMDVRSTIESMRRSITNAQSSVEQCRHSTAASTLRDIASCLSQLRQEARTVTESADAADEPLQALRLSVSPPS